MRPSFQQVQDKAMQDQYARDQAGFKEAFGPQGMMQAGEQRTYWDAMHAGNQTPTMMRNARLEMNNPFAPPIGAGQGSNGGRGGGSSMQKINPLTTRSSVNGVMPSSRFANVFK